MITVIVSDKKDFRSARIIELLSATPDSGVIVYDDTYGDVLELEQYLFPSLFTPAPPVVHAKYMLGDAAVDLAPALVNKMLASPTHFLFEEMLLPKSTTTMLKKSGAVIYQDEPTKNEKKKDDIFAVTKALTLTDKKSRWLAYESALSEYSIEAIVGILYWKVRDLISKSKNEEKEKHKKMYRELLEAHTRAWQSGAPLELLVEKVILGQ